MFCKDAGVQAAPLLLSSVGVNQNHTAFVGHYFQYISDI
jgi:hypothetical protein